METTYDAFGNGSANTVGAAICGEPEKMRFRETASIWDMLSIHEVAVDPQKVESVINWPIQECERSKRFPRVNGLLPQVHS